MFEKVLLSLSLFSLSLFPTSLAQANAIIRPYSTVTSTIPEIALQTKKPIRLNFAINSEDLNNPQLQAASHAMMTYEISGSFLNTDSETRDVSLAFGTLEDAAPASDPENDALFLGSYLIKMTHFDAQGNVLSAEELKPVGKAAQKMGDLIQGEAAQLTPLLNVQLKAGEKVAYQLKMVLTTYRLTAQILNLSSPVPEAE